MGSLAGLLKAAGHRVTGSDRAFYPPMGPALARWGVETRAGYDPANLEPPPDLVVVGNACRPDHVEARAAIDRGLRYASFPATLSELFLSKRRSLVVAGTHGKTTTSTILAYLLDCVGLDPGMLIGGIPRDFDESFRLGHEGGFFVVEGDEYDSAFFEKSPKLWQYRAESAILTSVEHDHIDIYPDEASYVAAFEGFVDRLPEDGVLVAWAGSPKVRELARRARCRVVYYALSSDDTGDVSPTWVAAPYAAQGGVQPFDLFVGGSATRTVMSPLSGLHNVLDATAAIALAAEAAGAPLDALLGALRSFRGVKRRQELLGTAAGVRVYDDFAHHPTAIATTLAGLRARLRKGRILAVLEPRSNTMKLGAMKAQLPASLAQADLVFCYGEKAGKHALGWDPAEVLAPMGDRATAWSELPAMVFAIVNASRPGDHIVVMSNGGFGGVHDKLLQALGEQSRAGGRP